MSPHYQQFTKEKKNLLKRETLKKGENTKSIAENINEKEEAQNLDHSIGIPLLIGFLFMFVVDQISKMSHSRHKSLSTLGLVIHSFCMCSQRSRLSNNKIQRMESQWEARPVLVHKRKCKFLCSLQLCSIK